MNKAIAFLMLILTISFSSCNDEDEIVNTLSVSTTEISFPGEGGSKYLTLETDARSWQIENQTDWILLETAIGNEEAAKVKLSVDSRSLENRTDSILVTAGNARPVYVLVSQTSSEYLYTLSANRIYIKSDRNADLYDMQVSSNATQWNLSSTEDWVQFSQQSGGAGTSLVEVTLLENPDSEVRTAEIVLSADYAPTYTLPVTQKGDLFESFNTDSVAPNSTGMSSSASQLAAKMTLGINIGNSLEAIGGETAWGNPAITEAYISLLKESGINSVRLPCSFNQYANQETGQISTAWLNRVKEVVEYCVSKDMYVLLNIHWDGGWLENNCTKAAQEANNAKQKVFWEQIATKLRDYDEHLIFASANEPNVDDATQMEVLLSYHQTFINAVRSTGGRNYYRVLVVQGPNTDIAMSDRLMNTLPEDVQNDRMMVEIHYYTPWNFCGLAEDASWGDMYYYWGANYHSTTDPSRNATSGEESTVDSKFAIMKNKFVDKGIPVVLGEYAPMRRLNIEGANQQLHLESRAYYIKYVTQQAKAYGLIPFYWDNGGTGHHASGIFDRPNNTVSDSLALEALIEGAKE